MHYQEAVTAFFTESPDEVTPAVVGAASPARRLRDAIEPIAMHDVWCPLTNERLAERGLDFLGSYVWGRASALGEPSAAVVASAFAVFEPGLVDAVYTPARGALARDELVRIRDEATGQSLRGVLGSLPGAQDAAAEMTAILRRGIEAADGTGRPLFSGLSTQPWPDDTFGQLWRACDILREYRGDSHTAVFVADGFSGADMNVFTELWLGMPLFAYSATRGWSEQALAEVVARLRADGLLDDHGLTDQGVLRRDALEQRTDAAMRPVIDAIGADLDGVVERLDSWSATLVEAKTFPPSVYKRAAG